MAFDYSAAPYPVRPDLPATFADAWAALAQPGNWWTGAERVAIARETRKSRDSELDRERKAALSPLQPDRGHEAAPPLSAAAVDAVHRVATDAARLTQNYLETLSREGISDGHYVELVGIVSTLLGIDGFHRALGLPLEPLPAAQPGTPSQHRPAGLTDQGGWLPALDPKTLAAEEADIYEGMPFTANVIKALSLVPDAVRLLHKLSRAQYLPVARILDFHSEPDRALSRAQMEFIAARVSHHNACFY